MTLCVIEWQNVYCELGTNYVCEYYVLRKFIWQELRSSVSLHSE